MIFQRRLFQREWQQIVREGIPWNASGCTFLSSPTISTAFKSRPNIPESHFRVALNVNWDMRCEPNWWLSNCWQIHVNKHDFRHSWKINEDKLAPGWYFLCWGEDEVLKFLKYVKLGCSSLWGNHNSGEVAKLYGGELLWAAFLPAGPNYSPNWAYGWPYYN